VDFAEIEALQRAGDWDGAGTVLGEAARGLAGAGADLIVICTNTMHICAPAIAARAARPVLHIADPTAAAVRAAGISTVGLIGTRFTMEQDFYVGRLREQHGLRTLVPEVADRVTAHHIIFDELVKGVVRDDSRAEYRRIIRALVEQGAEGVILGCTEIGLLIGPDDASVPLFDTTLLHARAAADAALA
jgi:aspartate racemase